MWFRKSKLAEQGRAPGRPGGQPGRQVEQGRPSPAFSYYTGGRDSDANRSRVDRLAGRSEQSTAGQGKRLPRFSASQLPFWVLTLVVVVCGLKILWLSGKPKVIILGKNATTETYMRSSDVYAAAAQKVLSNSPTNHTKLTINLSGTANSLEHEFPELQAVSVGVPLISSRPIVYVQVADPSLILETTHGNYALNKSGVVLAKLRSIPDGVPLVVDQSGVQPQPGKQFLPSSTVSFVQTVTYQLTAAHLTISTFTLPTDSPYELDVRLSPQPYYVRFNLQASSLTQSGAAIATVQQVGGAATTYMDVRVPGRVYYK